MPGTKTTFHQPMPRPLVLTKLLAHHEASTAMPMTRTWRSKVYNRLFSRMHQHPFAATFLVVQSLVFLLSLLNYTSSNGLNTLQAIYGTSYVVAKAAGAVLYFDVAIVMLPVCRLTISFLKQKFLGRSMQFDEDGSLHRMVGWSIAAFTWVHVAAHWITLARLAGRGHQGFYGFLLANLATGSGASGYAMLISLMLISFTYVKKLSKSSYKQFWTVHHLYVFFFVSWSLHGAFSVDLAPTASWTSTSTFWQYWLCGGMVYLVEIVYRELRRTRKSQILRVIQHPSYVVEIQIKKGSLKPKTSQVSPISTI